jgi:PadR family transcriptional regulator PadR
MRHGGRAARGRHARGWFVRARIERMHEAYLLLLLRDRPTHGYELLERLPELVGYERVEAGNVYRLLRGLEEAGAVSSEWDAGLPGPAKRTYELTPLGRRLLDEWAQSLRAARDRIDGFLRRYEGR